MVHNDLNDVAAWLKCRPEDLSIRTERVSIEAFASHIESCVSSYPHFPDDEKRMRKILRQLQKGALVFPVFIEDGDSTMFILEGRHRIVAFHEYGLKEVEVAFVAKSKKR